MRMLCLLLCLPAAAATYHVAPNGDDAAPGAEAAPWRTLARCVQGRQPGDTVIIHAGTYREWLRPESSGSIDAPICYRAAPGEQVIVTGADVITGWQRDPARDGAWSVAWPHRFIINTVDGRPVYHHPGDDFHRVAGRPEQVVVDGGGLQQVLWVDELGPGTFCADPEAARLTVLLPEGDDPAGHTVEASTRSMCFGEGWGSDRKLSHIAIEGIWFRYAASFAQRGAVSLGGDHLRLEDCRIEQMAGAGLTVTGGDHLIRQVTCVRNGQIGGGVGGGRNVLFDQVDFVLNNTEGFSAGWEAGGIKVTFARGTHLLGCRAIGNRGSGLWYDIDNRDSRVEACVTAFNADSGIFFEISGPNMAARDNLCFGNGTSGQWGTAGVLVAESIGATIERNRCYANHDGLAIRQQGVRGLRSLDGEELKRQIDEVTFGGNVAAGNAASQFALYWDNPGMGPHPSPEVGMRGDPLEPDQAHIALRGNALWADEGQPLIVWGAPWRPKHVVYDDPTAFEAAHPPSAGNTLAQPHFRAPAWGDYAPQGQATEAGTVVIGGETMAVEPLPGDGQWTLEQQPGANFEWRGGRLHLTSRGERGSTAWYRPELPENVLVTYRCRALAPAEAANLNAFLAAREADGAELRFGRDGSYPAYRTMLGYGFTFTGAHNHEQGWTRLRRYPSFALVSGWGDRQAVAGHDYTVALAKEGGRLRVWVDGQLLHDWRDDQPLGPGKFGFRTWSSEVELWDVSFYRLR